VTPATPPLWFTDADLIAKLTAVEDQFVERKSKGDKGEWLQTTVAFANSTPIGYPAVLFIGVDNEGVIAENLKVEDLMKSFADHVSAKAWPPIYTAPHILTHDGKSCIAVIIPGSESRPHFAGKSYVRKGTQTEEASDDQFQKLVAERTAKVYDIRKWIGKQITLHALPSAKVAVILLDCNQHFLTWRAERPASFSAPMEWTVLSFDHENNRLKIYLSDSR
jgi:hypothetical protein